MLNLLKDILLSPLGSFASVFSLFALAFWLVYWITKKVTLFDSQREGTNAVVTKIDGHIDEIRRDLSYLKGTIDIIKTGGSPLAKSHSPVSLTDEGIRLATELNADDMICRNWDRIFDILEKNIQDKNAYDIQQYCLETVAVEPDMFFEKADLEKLKQFAYAKGNSLQYYSPIFGIKIRDKYLGIKKINVTDIDLHDPKKQ